MHVTFILAICMINLLKYFELCSIYYIVGLSKCMLVLWVTVQYINIQGDPVYYV